MSSSAARMMPDKWLSTWTMHTTPSTALCKRRSDPAAVARFRLSFSGRAICAANPVPRVVSCWLLVLSAVRARHPVASVAFCSDALIDHSLLVQTCRLVGVDSKLCASAKKLTLPFEGNKKAYSRFRFKVAHAELIPRPRPRRELGTSTRSGRYLTFPSSVSVKFHIKMF